MTILQSLSFEQVQRELARLKAAGIESLAICLLHAYANPTHEELVGQIAREHWLHAKSACRTRLRR